MAVGLTGKIIIVTGASRGLGAETAVAFARRGAQVAVLARKAGGLERTAARVTEAGGEAMVCVADIRDRSAIDAALQQTISEWGRVDVWINAAGIKREGPVESVSDADVADTLAVNYLGALNGCRAVLPVMRGQGNGHIINVSSVLGKRGTPQRGAYSASKAALNAMTESLRVEMMGTGIHVSLICPGRLEEPGENSGSKFAMNSARAATRIVRCAERPRADIVLTLAGNVLWRLNALAPGLVDRILYRARRRG